MKPEELRLKVEVPKGAKLPKVKPVKFNTNGSGSRYFRKRMREVRKHFALK